MKTSHKWFILNSGGGEPNNPYVQAWIDKGISEGGGTPSDTLISALNTLFDSIGDTILAKGEMLKIYGLNDVSLQINSTINFIDPDLYRSVLVSSPTYSVKGFKSTGVGVYIDGGIKADRRALATDGFSSLCFMTETYDTITTESAFGVKAGGYLLVRPYSGTGSPQGYPLSGASQIGDNSYGLLGCYSTGLLKSRVYADGTVSPSDLTSTDPATSDNIYDLGWNQAGVHREPLLNNTLGFRWEGYQLTVAEMNIIRDSLVTFFFNISLTYHAKYQAVLDKAISLGAGFELPTKPVQDKQDILMRKIDNMGILNNGGDVIRVYGHDGGIGFGLINWVNAELNLGTIPNGGISQINNIGYYNNVGAAAKYILDNYNPSIDANHYTVEDACVMYYKSSPQTATTSISIYESSGRMQFQPFKSPVGEAWYNINGGDVTVMSYSYNDNGLWSIQYKSDLPTKSKRLYYGDDMLDGTLEELTLLPTQSFKNCIYGNDTFSFLYYGKSCIQILTELETAISTYLTDILFLDYTYGDLESIYPSYTYSQLSDIRKANWTLFKAHCDIHKRNNFPLMIPDRRLEMYVNEGEKVNIRNIDNLTIQGVSKESTSIVIYPIAPKEGVKQTIFYLDNKSTFSLKNLTLTGVDLKKYETYSCVLKKGGDSKVIEVLGVIRTEFWDELEVGETLFYGWAINTQGKTNTIASWDSTAKTITLTNDIDGAVANDKSGDYVKVGVYFKQEISLIDYNTYGDMWYISEGFDFITHSGDEVVDDTIITLDEVLLSKAEILISISSKACKVYLTNTTIKQCEIGLDFYSLDEPNNQQIHIDNLTVEECGYVIAGGITSGTAGNVLGAGMYMHPNIAVKKIGLGRLNLINNIANSCQQYSASGPKPIAVGSTTEFGIINASGNTESDLTTSNSMPVTIDELNSTHTVMVGGDLDVKKGDIAGTITITSQHQPPASKLSNDIIFRNCNIRGLSSFGWSSSRMINTTINYFDCNFYGVLTGYMISSEVLSLKQLNIIGGSFVKGDADVDYYTQSNSMVTNGLKSLTGIIRSYGISNIYIQDFSTERLMGYAIVDQQSNDPDYLSKTMEFNNCDIQTQGLVAANLLPHSDSIIADGTNINAPYAQSNIGPSFKFSQKIGSTTKSIISSDNYVNSLNVRVTLNSVLELDYLNNEYTVASGTINTIGVLYYFISGNNLRKAVFLNSLVNEVIIHASGGNLIFTKFDSITNTESNIKNDYTCLEGESCKLTINRKEVLATSTNTSSYTTIGTGNGSKIIFTGPINITEKIVAGTASLTAGAITGAIDSDGIITGTGIVKGQLDYYGTGYYIEFSTPPANGTDIIFNYDKYNGYKNMGTATVSAYP